MDAISFDAPRQRGSRLLAIFSIVTASLIMTGCATNATNNIQSADNSDSFITTPSERVAITYKNKNNNNNNLDTLPPEVEAFLNEGKIDNNKITAVTPTRIGTGHYNHEMLNNAKATDIVAIDPNKFAPPLALPDYGITSDENLQTPVDFVAQAPAYFAAAQPPQIVTRTTRTTSYASVQSKSRAVSKSSKVAKNNIKPNPAKRVKAKLPARKK